MSNHVLAPRKYLWVFAALLGLTALTILAYRVPMGILHTPVALGIAAAKATLVLLIFMHLLYSPRFTWVAALSGLAWLAILIVLTMADYVTRHQSWVPAFNHDSSNSAVGAPAGAERRSGFQS